MSHYAGQRAVAAHPVYPQRRRGHLATPALRDHTGDDPPCSPHRVPDRQRWVLIGLAVAVAIALAVDLYEDKHWQVLREQLLTVALAALVVLVMQSTYQRKVEDCRRNVEEVCSRADNLVRNWGAEVAWWTERRQRVQERDKKTFEFLNTILGELQRKHSEHEHLRHALGGMLQQLDYLQRGINYLAHQLGETDNQISERLTALSGNQAVMIDTLGQLNRLVRNLTLPPDNGPDGGPGGVQEAYEAGRHGRVVPFPGMLPKEAAYFDAGRKFERLIKKLQPGED